MEKRQVYRCSVCGNIVEVLYVGGGTLVCCGQPMELQEEHTQDAGAEKHVPVIEQKGTYVTVKVGEIPHPMEENHYIEWIELIVDGEIYRKFLTYTDKPEASFTIPDTHIEISARAYCNVHGLWKS
ncbi:MAG: desulfoferrodoxin [Candidatus Dojkabacteria bacterium]|nr:desulfoferrodoxin [Candidatus Dojkabacteria bacterium]